MTDKRFQVCTHLIGVEVIITDYPISNPI